MSILIVVPSLGERPAWLATCLDSILQQEDCEVQVRLVGPDVSALREAATRSGVTFVPTAEPGAAAAINLGFAPAADFEFVNWLGDDDVLAPDGLRTLRNKLQAAPAASFAYGRTRYIDAGGNTIGLTRPSRWAAAYARYGKDFIPQPSSLIRASSLLQSGGLRTDLKNAFDLDLFLRLQAVGRAVYVPREISAYRLHGGSITVNKGANDEGEHVRRSHQHGLRRSANALGRPLTRLLEHYVDAAFRHLPCPSPLSRAGVPYTEGAVPRD